MNVFFNFDISQKKSFAKYLCGLLLLVAFFSFIVFLSPVSTPVLNIKATSSVSGESQLFFNNGELYKEENSVRSGIKAGENDLRYPVSIVASPLRWDPLNDTGTIEVHSVRVSIFGMDFLPGGLSFRALNQISGIDVVSDKYIIRMQPDAVDPELEMTFDANEVGRLRFALSVAVGLVLSVVFLLAVYWAKEIKIVVGKTPSWLFVLLLLALLNVTIFYDHIFGQSVFPWDFSLTYHAIPSYWLTSLQLGQFPLWVPFQGMGYPLLMNMQSGLFYLPNYFFYLFNVPYTLHAAVVFQIVHVFFAGVGAYVFLRKSGQDVLSSTIGSVAYNLFGGFFCNSEHLDIIRSFAFLPWIFAGLAGLMRDGVKPFPVIVVPLFLLLQWTGGYPGSSISIVFISFVFIFSSAVAKQCSWRRFLIGGGLIVSGVLMASPAFLPVLMLKSEIARSTEAGSLAKTFIEPANFISLIHGIDFPGLPGDISMRSLHIVIIPFVFIFFINFRMFKNNIGMTAVACCALLMGVGGWGFDSIVKLLPPLGYSRFPSADYRGFIALSVVYFSMLGYQEYKAVDFSVVQDRLVRFVFFGVLGYLIVDPLILNYDAFVFALAIVVLVVLVLCVHRLKLSPVVVFFLFFSIQMTDFIRVEAGRTYWNNPVISGSHFEKFGSLKSPSILLEQRINGVSSRAERSDEFTGQDFGYQGYLTGIYMVGDYSGPMQFLRQRYIVSHPELLNYAKRAWTPIFFNGQPGADEALAAIKSDKNVAGDLVEIELYQPNKIVYEVKSNSKFGFLENETYFPGWTMTINGGSVIEAKDIHGFRYWDMPAGTYQAIAKFKMPHLRMSIFISIFGLFALLFFIGGVLKFRKK